MADLFLARSAGAAGVERLVAVKLVAARFTHDEALMQMFEDEARIAATLDHPNIGQVFEVGEVDGQYFLAMEHLHGRDLRHVITTLAQRGTMGLPLEVVAYIGARVCAALHCAHEAVGLDGQRLEIIHRDVSPSNIMLTYAGHVKLVDFGIAKAANRLSLTRPGCIKGKVRYLSPEQLEGRAVDRRSDLFTLGISLWESCCGRHLFDAVQDFQVFEAISKAEVPSPRAIHPAFPVELERILFKALARDPAARYASALEMQQDLERFARAVGVTLSELRVAAFMRTVYREDIDGWEQAKRAGTGLLAYLMQVDEEGEFSQEDPGDEPLSRTDDRQTVAPTARSRTPRPPGGRDTPSARYSDPMGPVDEESADTRTDTPRKTVMFGSMGAHRASAFEEPPAETPRKTILYGSGPRRENEAAPLEVARSPRSDLEVDEICDPGRPTLMSLARAPSINPADAPPVADDRRAPERRHAVTPAEPVVIREEQPIRRIEDGGSAHPSRHSDPAGPVEAGREDSASRHLGRRQKRPRTGDWAHQASKVESRRPGTHPYFKEDRSTVYGDLSGPEHVLRPRNRQLIVALTVVLLLGGMIFAWRGMMRRSRVSARAKAMAASSLPKVRITSQPAGATVFSAISGQELGKTPLDLPREAMRGQRIELHLVNYEVATLTIDGTSSHQSTTLRSQSRGDARPLDAQMIDVSLHGP